MGSLFKPKMETNVTFLSLKDIDVLQPNLFESAVAALYGKQGFEIFLTPFYNNKGINIVALKSNENFLIQVKQTNLNVAFEDIRELFSAKTYYENKFKTAFNLLLVTNSNFSDSLLSLESSKKVKLINRSQLDILLTSNKLLIPDINRIETQRLTNI
jgi:HJR/Mrr/RecB family endonuclease